MFSFLIQLFKSNFIVTCLFQFSKGPFVMTFSDFALRNLALVFGRQEPGTVLLMVVSLCILLHMHINSTLTIIVLCIYSQKN